MLAQQTESLIAPPLQMQHRPSQQLDRAIIGRRADEAVDRGNRRAGVAGGVLSESIDGLEVRLRCTSGFLHHRRSLAARDARPQSVDLGGDDAFGRQARCALFQHGGVLALVEGVVEVQEL